MCDHFNDPEWSVLSRPTYTDSKRGTLGQPGCLGKTVQR